MSEVAAPEYVMPEADAERLTRRITLMAGTLREGMEKLHGLVAEAKSGNAHVALGYPSWTAYLAATLGKEPLRLERGARQELVGYLAGEGMSTRAIAPIVGANQATVVRDLRGDANASPDEPEDIPEQEFLALTANATEAQFEDALTSARAEGDLSRTNVASRPARAEVTGMDGKTYTRPAPRDSKPRRKPITDSARDAGWELRKATERVQRLTEDDRFSTNKEQVAAYLRSHLLNAIEVCQDLVNQLDQSQED